MSSWFVLLMKWGGAGLTIVFSAALVYATYVTATENVALKASFWGLIVIGMAMAVAGYRWERKYLQGNE